MSKSTLIHLSRSIWASLLTCSTRSPEMISDPLYPLFQDFTGLFFACGKQLLFNILCKMPNIKMMSYVCCSSFKYFFIWTCRSVVICSGIIPLSFNDFKAFSNPVFSILLEFPVSVTCVLGKCSNFVCSLVHKIIS